MRDLKDVIDQIISISTHEVLKADLRALKEKITADAPAFVMKLNWDITELTLAKHIPDTLGSEEAITIVSIFTGLTEAEVVQLMFALEDIKLVDGFRFIGSKENVCGGDPIIIGTRLQPKQIVAYGTKSDAMEDFDLTKEQVEECYVFVEKQS